MEATATYDSLELQMLKYCPVTGMCQLIEGWMWKGFICFSIQKHIELARFQPSLYEINVSIYWLFD